jgi:hypothetical protein
MCLAGVPAARIAVEREGNLIRIMMRRSFRKAVLVSQSFGRA